VKTEFITFRPALSRAVIRRLAHGNVSRLLNRLLEQYLTRQPEKSRRDWREHWQRKAKSDRAFNFSHIGREDER
jgi:hypothetical protein